MKDPFKGIGGPAIEWDAAIRIGRLMNLPEWDAFVDYLSTLEDTAFKGLRSVNNTPAMDSYFKGILACLGDLKALKPDLIKKLETARMQTERDNDGLE